MGVNLGPPNRLVPGVGGPVGVGGVGGVGVNTGSHTPDNAMWPHSGVTNVPGGVGGRNPGAWGDDCNHNVIGSSANTSNWSDDKSNQPGGSVVGGSSGGLGALTAANVVSNANAWNDPPAGSWNKTNSNKLPGASSWGVVTATAGNAGGNDNQNDLNPADWSNATHNLVMAKSQPNKLGGVNLANMTNDMKQSKQFRILLDAGFKKDDIERALINTNMNMDEATEMLRANFAMNMDNWRRHDDSVVGSFNEHPGVTGGGGGVANFAGRYVGANAGAQPQAAIAFPPVCIIK